jgi:hypothetical protein
MTMKIVVFVALLIAFIGGYLIARAKYKPQIIELSKMVTEKDTALTQLKSSTNKLMMKDNMMWVVENGEARQMDSDIMMSNGTKVMMDGKVLNSDGSESTLSNGDAIDMDGKMMPANTDSNSDSGY